MYNIIFKPKAEKGLNKLHPKDIKKVVKIINEFSLNPFFKRFNVKKLGGFPHLEKAYRLRISNIRVIYEFYPKQKLIIIYFIDYRRSTTYAF